MRSLGRVAAAVTLVAALGAAQAVTVAAPVGAGDIPDEDQVDVPIVDGVTIVATYGYERMPFFQGGFILKPPQLDNFVSIDCGENGEVNPVGGPKGAPECSFHPPVTEATVTITGEQPWFDVAESFQLVPYWSFDDETYVEGKPITVEAPKASKGKVTKEEAGQLYVGISEVVNQKVTTTVETIKSWDGETTGKQAAADVESLDHAFDEAKAGLKKLKKKYPSAKQEIADQRKAINALQVDLAAAGGINDGVDLADWKEQFNGHLKDLQDASDGVRGKLGLILIFEDGDAPEPEPNESP